MFSDETSRLDVDLLFELCSSTLVISDPFTIGHGLFQESDLYYLELREMECD